MSLKVPEFAVDPSWPKALPNGWSLGQVPSVAVSADDHVWLIHRPGTVAADLTPAPPMLEFDAAGDLVRFWGTSGSRLFANEHTVYIDTAQNVWVGGNSTDDQVVIKCTTAGEHLLQLGQWGKTNGSNDSVLLGQPADVVVDPVANEVYIADGYGNRRVVVFDATTGNYRRHWGAYGRVPRDGELPAYHPDSPPSDTFGTPVHSVRISNDGRVYVLDRVGNRVQVFEKDGTYLDEVFIAKETVGGAAWDADFSPDSDQTYMYVADGTNRKVWILDRTRLEIIGSFGQSGVAPGEFVTLHNLASDSLGNLYTAEVGNRRVQKFVRIS